MNIEAFKKINEFTAYELVSLEAWMIRDSEKDSFELRVKKDGKTLVLKFSDLELEEV